MISFDTETTGVDLHHGAKPFFATLCTEDNEVTFFEWDVDPLTRQPTIPDEDLKELEGLLWTEEEKVLQNPKFDYQAMDTLPWKWPAWDWARTKDTLMAGHLLASNQPHDLTSMALVYCGVNIQPYEDAIEVATKHAQRICRSKDFIAKHPGWQLAKKGEEDMPSAKKAVWKFDMWLPRAICRLAPEFLPDEHDAFLNPKGWKLGDDPGSHSWWTALANYGNADSSITGPLFKAQRLIIERRGLWKIYEARLTVLPVVYAMEKRGITLNADRLDKLFSEYSEEAEKNNRVCVNLSGGKLPALPKGGKSNALEDTVFNELGLKSNKKTDKGADSMDKYVIEHWLTTLPERSKQYCFVRNLQSHRKRSKACGDMSGYRRFMLPWVPVGPVDPITGAGWYVLHPSLNPTGTDTLRWSSSNPNEQNISKKEGFNLRYCFGPAPGREWWSCDAQNIELRIPAYEAGEEAMLDIFERPKDPPFYGSYHMLIFATLHPEKFAQYGMKCKDIYEATWYQWTKNGDFAVGYGSVESSGTADRAYHVPGAFARVKKLFKRIHGPGGLNDQQIAHAERYGYVETIPDKTVDPEHGYPLLCTRTSYGKILPTVPLNYHVQGTAMWWMKKAMVRCYNMLQQWNQIEMMAQKTRESVVQGLQHDGYHLIMQVHDELVFDFPKRYTPPRDGEPAVYGNLPKMRMIKRLMQQGGDDIGIPTPVSLKYHSDTWSEGVSL